MRTWIQLDVGDLRLDSTPVFRLAHGNCARAWHQLREGHFVTGVYAQFHLFSYVSHSSRRLALAFCGFLDHYNFHGNEFKRAILLLNNILCYNYFMKHNLLPAAFLRHGASHFHDRLDITAHGWSHDQQVNGANDCLLMPRSRRR